MKRASLLFSILVFASVFFISCDKEKENDENTILVKNNEELKQAVYADETVGNSAVNFTTTAAWSSTMVETTRPQASGKMKATENRTPSWVSIDPKNGDKAGDYAVNISLQPNYTGSERSANIYILCGDAKITITVTQKETKEDGTLPGGEGKSNIVTDIESSVSMGWHFDYDDQNRVIVIQQGTVNSKIQYSNGGESIEESRNGMITYYKLSQDGKIYNQDNDNLSCAFSYSGDYLTKIYYNMFGGVPEIYDFAWENGKMKTLEFDYGKEGYTMQQEFEYGNVKNNSNIDINFLLTILNVGNYTRLSGLCLFDHVGKRSENLVSTVKSNEGNSISYSYETNANGYVEKIYSHPAYGTEELIYTFRYK